MRQPKQQPFAPKISLKKLSNKSYNLQSLIKQASKRKTLEQRFNESLPALFRGKFQVNTLNNGALTLTCQSAALMTKFRFSQTKTINAFNQANPEQTIRTIKIKVRPTNISSGTQTKAATNKQQKQLSKKNAQILQEEAEHTDDVKLKEILLQLAKHGD